MRTDVEFWQALDRLVGACRLVIDRPKGSHHPMNPEITYPVDYGYLDGTTSMDGSGVDVWCGTDPTQQVDTVICTVDLRKKDSEIKILIGCKPEEKQCILSFHNQAYMKAMLVKRSDRAKPGL